ncbi:hypothetical protein PVAND_010744 [Polypedilum vanderplanki]|uniref:BHLH domain-containing protein n=1 Tax=Polypedilum vanderplanki TaxID=319348 RepID=A0A9J6CH73_POLVA|nr:hypothetical protein PVAND_010744 [Polypedilum vanderplanki]
MEEFAQFSYFNSCIYADSKYKEQNNDYKKINQVQQHLFQQEIFDTTKPCSTTSIDNYVNSSRKDKSKKIRGVQERKNTLSSINAAYDELRVHVPTFPYEKRLSKIDTLQLAISYISLLQDVLEVDYDPLTYVQKCMKGEIKANDANWNTSDLTARLSWINWENLGVHPSRQSNNLRSWC